MDMTPSQLSFWVKSETKVNALYATIPNKDQLVVRELKFNYSYASCKLP